MAPEEQNPKLLSPLTLAFVGDGVYELLVRKRIVEAGSMPPKKLNAYEFCRFLSLSTFFLIGSDRTEYDSDIGTGIILKSPEKAFAAAGEMIGYLFGSPGTVWQASATL